MSADYDLIVVGAGPAGTTLASLVKKHAPAARVLIVEKTRFPRHHIGESLLPGMIPVLKEMGVYEKINAEGFPRKMGAVFVWGEDRKPWDADFNNLNVEMLQKYGRALDAEFSWQVLRSRYDEILLDHARSLGVEARMATRAVSAIEKDGVACGLVVEDELGRRERLSCRTLADCSGQAGFLGALKKVRAYREDLKNVAAYAYFRGAKWKFEFAGHPDKTKIFVCSVPEGWFWYIPISKDVVSVGLVSKADAVKRDGLTMRERYFRALRRCAEIAPLLEGAQRLKGVDPADAQRDFFTAGDWSYKSERACGPGWLAAGDAAFFIDPLLSSGVMMAHLSGHRAAYSVLTSWREEDAGTRRALWRDYDRFCREVGDNFLTLVSYWYRHDANAPRWWTKARQAALSGAPVDLDDKLSFVAVAAGITYYFERAYTMQSMIFGQSGAEHSWQWEGTKLELRRWTRQILAIVETGFMKRRPKASKRLARAEKLVRLERVSDGAVPRLLSRPKEEITFLPAGEEGVLRPVRRFRFKAGVAGAPEPKRVLPESYARALALIDGRRNVAAIRAALLRDLDLPADIVEGQLFRLLKDLAVVGALELGEGKAGARPAPALPAGPFRRGEALLRAGDPAAAEASLSRAVDAGRAGAWAFALRGEARRHLGRLEEAAADLDRALALCALSSAGGRGLKAGLKRFDASIKGAWLEDRVRILRAKLRLAKGDVSGAGDDADRALTLNPRQSEALVLRAKAAMASGRMEQARLDLRDALEIESDGKRGQG